MRAGDISRESLLLFSVAGAVSAAVTVVVLLLPLFMRLFGAAVLRVAAVFRGSLCVFFTRAPKGSRAQPACASFQPRQLKN